ncbi:GNAT family N-acetyltransferase [Burkholderia gladioli]|uniref:GNAT family N-acetyltransferase n=1 Tax=Burkholderia gladioli TaxID=28095 RepID=UPI001C250764|nr:GNAT family protein [Burkholderia gladioli]MBU9683545.1 GNAT family N-acetyltransferase [Burkholderia gladioli]MCA8171871.1 GNAT family N-acetyltransferase [Burkholderia gladioli]
MVDNRQSGLVGPVTVLEPVTTVSARHRSTDESNPKSNQEKMNPVYTDRLVIRRPSQEDLHAFLAYRNAHENMRLQPIERMPHAEALTFLAKQAELTPDADNCWLMFAMELRESRGMIGEVGMYIESGSKQTCDIGWSLNRAFCGQGYATEAAKWLIEFAFRERRLHRITSNASTQNTESIRLMERLGMRREGTTRESMLVHGVWHDEHRYAMLSREWHG